MFGALSMRYSLITFEVYWEENYDQVVAATAAAVATMVTAVAKQIAWTNVEIKVRGMSIWSDLNRSVQWTDCHHSKLLNLKKNLFKFQRAFACIPF